MKEPIKVYGTDTCPKCNAVKQHLKKKGVTFESINILDHPEFADQLSANAILALPVVTCGDKMIAGFNTKMLDEFIEEVK